MACNNEQEAEIVDLREAMAASLAEAEDRRTQGPAQAGHAVLEPYRDTNILQQVGCRAPCRVDIEWLAVTSSQLRHGRTVRIASQ